MPGTLYVIATPLGNLEDLSQRALETLRAVSCIACEDTRRTSRLLARYEIRATLLSCHRFNEAARLDPLLLRLRGGDDVALVSDGGTPGVSDPGARLVRTVLDAGLAVRPIPGPSAVTTLLSASGLDADRYVFDGFLPHRGGERRRRLRELVDEPRTLVVFESPRRLRDTLADIAAIFGERTVVLGRELTKLHETILRGSAAELLDRAPGEARGEVTLGIAGAGAEPGPGATTAAIPAIVSAWRRALEAAGGDHRAALRRAAREVGLRRAELYRRLVELGEHPDSSR